MLQTGFEYHKPKMASNHDGHGTTFTTTFTATNSFLVTPVAHCGLNLNKPDDCKPHHDWLQKFNGLTGDFTSNLLNCVFSPEFQTILKNHGDITNPPCPGNTPGLNRYITSIQVNSSTVDKHVQGLASNTYQDRGDDPLSFSISFNCSVLR